MTRYFSPALAVVTAGLMTTSAGGAMAQAGQGGNTDIATTVQVRGGIARFEVDTNISAINVHGKSDRLAGRAQLRLQDEVITIERMEATLPVHTVTTGMGLRDEHMRKYIFTTADGHTPDVKYTGDRAACSPAPGRAGESTCLVSGQLAIRGTERPFAITLKVKKLGDSYRAAGDGTVTLSAYGIARPSQLGVTTSDDVRLHIEFTAKHIGGQALARAGDVR